MKAKYVKPQLQVEYFSLTQSVATACGWNAQVETELGKPMHGDPYTCAWVDPFGEYFFLEKPVCVEECEDENAGGAFCYNAPSGEVQIFAS